MESLELIESILAQHQALSSIISSDDLLSIRDKLIKFDIKNPDIDRIQATRHLASWVEPLLITGSNPKIESDHRVCAIDALSIVFGRLGGIIKTASSEVEKLQSIDEGEGYRCVSIFRDYFDQAPPPLLKSLKDCLTAFVAVGKETWGAEQQRNISVSIAREVFGSYNHSAFRKGDLYLLEFLIKKRWLPSKLLFAKEGVLPVVNLESTLRSMSNRTLAPGIGRLLGSLLRRLQDELAEEVESEVLKKTWLEYFQEDLANALFSTDEQLGVNTQLYVIPSLFHIEREGLSLFMQYLFEASKDSKDSHNSLAIIGCLKTGKESGWLTESQVDEYATFFGGYHALLGNPHGLIRSQALRLMLISSSTAAPLSSTYIEILRGNLDYFFAESEPQVRNEIYSAFRVLLERLVASSYALNKRLHSLEGRPKGLDADAAAENEHQSIKLQLSEQKSFIIWFLRSLLPSQLHPNASYQRVILALKVYSFWLPQLDRDTSSPRGGSDLTSDVRKSKKKQVDREHIVLPFDPEIDYSILLRLLVERIIDPYDDIRALAAGLIKELPQSTALPWPHILQRAQKLIEHSGRPGQSNGLSRILEVLHDLSSKDSNVAREVWESYDSSAANKSIVDLAFMLLDREPNSQCENNLRSQIDNSVLGALALIYKRNDATGLFDSHEENQNTLDVVLRLTRKIWSQEREILCNESPEGRGLVSGEDSDDEEEDQLNSQGFLSHSWRVVSEASSLLGAIVKYTPSAYTEATKRDEFLRDSGDLLIEQLTSIRHRGSLSSIFPALTSICFQCLVSTSKDVQELPKVWINKLLSVVSSSGKLITRRSAGLPMAIGAILISEIQAKSKQRGFIKYVFQSLQDTIDARPKFTDTGNDHLELPQVHALNCMRFLFMDSQLAFEIDAYVASSLRMAFACFKSDIWAVRNCGIMLYTAIVSRIFPRDGSSRNFNSRRFFQRYSGIDAVFLKPLSDGFQDLSDHRLVEAVYPALDVISRLSFVNDIKSQNEAITPSEEFKNLILRYLGCKIWKIREAAAKSILAFTTSEAEALALMEDFLSWNNESEQRENNLIHGGLCAAREIYEQRLVGVNDEIQKSAIILILKTSELYLGEDAKVSPVNQAFFLQLSGIVFGNEVELLHTAAVPFCRRTLLEARGSPSKGFARSLLQKEIARIMAAACPDISVGFLSFNDPEYGVSLSEALFNTEKPVDLHRKLELDTIEAGADTSFAVLHHILNHHDWEPYRVAAANILLLSSRQENLESEPLMLIASRGPTEPLRESALILTGKSLASLTDDKLVELNLDSIQSWIKELLKNIQDEMPYSSRMAALRSIEAYFGVSRTSASRETTEHLPLPVSIIIQKLLNDDDDDIRALAAEIIARLLSQAGRGDYKLVTPLQAEKMLFEQYPKMGISDPATQQLLLEGILGIPLQNVEDIKQQLITANTPNTLLFKIEKQNLYRDDVRCMEYYIDLLSNPSIVVPEGETRDQLVRYVAVGMETLWEIAHEHQLLPNDEGGVSIAIGKLRTSDGIMGWTTATEEIFIFGLRVANMFKVLSKWYSSKPELVEVRRMVERFVEYGEREDVAVNSMWLGRFKEGLCMRVV
ncbi:hypothetical protein H072_1688 [Dactylellina haptotyla CBS 200.50]|uniref:Uncharacterized protein n=1 Tax=Dactylellina haptotyla (strain CBS 200.50) TaxID=1284197 RepID=S8AN30_DACHA|nr:hypothetical protein H072_1688 [Dactylellina haptotyla CBS 200.50]